MQSGAAARHRQRNDPQQASRRSRKDVHAAAQQNESCGAGKEFQEQHVRDSSVGEQHAVVAVGEEEAGGDIGAGAPKGLRGSSVYWGG